MAWDQIEQLLFNAVARPIAFSSMIYILINSEHANLAWGLQKEVVTETLLIISDSIPIEISIWAYFEIL